MEPFKTHGATLPRQGLTHPAEGCPIGPRPVDLMQGGDEGANPHPGQRVAMECEAVYQATAGTSRSSGVSASTQEDNHESNSPTTSQDDISKGPDTMFLTRLDMYKRLVARSKEINVKWRPPDLPMAERLKVVSNALGNYKPSLTEEELKLALSILINKCETLYKKSHRNMVYFVRNNKKWLDEYFVQGKIAVTTPKSKKFLSLSSRQQLRSTRKLEKLLDEEPKVKKIKSFVNSMSSVGNDKEVISSKVKKDFEFVINTCLESKTAPTETANKIKETTLPFSTEEALAIIIDQQLTADTYKYLRTQLRDKRYSGFPPYYKVEKEKKSCYPNEDLIVTEREANVSLQGLLNHTFQRLVKACETYISDFCEQNAVKDNILKCNFEGSWGFDGSSGQAFYKQAFADDTSDEGSLFATTFIPLRITAADNHIIWHNPSPQSYRFCRPIRIQYKKESKEVILCEKKYIEDQIARLTPLVATTSLGHTLQAECKLYLTVIDGKVLNTILDTPSQLRCPYCAMTATQFNNLDEAYKKIPKKEALLHGICPLHAWIRVLEFLLKLGYKSTVKKWRIAKGSPEDVLVDERKKTIQTEIRKRTGVLVDVVRPNSGTTNDGNAARTVLSDKNRHIFSEILNIEQWLVDGLHTVLVVLSCGLPVDAEKFGGYCHTLAYKYVATYPWHPMTVTIHKILVHGKDIIEAFPLPISMLSEQAAESRNKFWRSDREHHCRKMTRELTITDLFHRALESSDPLISTLSLKKRQKYRRRNPLPATVVELLKPINTEENTDTDTEQEDESLVDDSVDLELEAEND